MNSNLIYVNALWAVDYCQCYLWHYFSTIKDKVLQDSRRVNSNLIYVHAFCSIDYRRCYLGCFFSCTKVEALQDSWWVNNNLIYINVLWVVDYRWCYLDHYFSITKNEALQDSWRMNSKFIPFNVLWVIDCRRCYLNHHFSTTKDETLQDSLRVNSNHIHVKFWSKSDFYALFIKKKCNWCLNRWHRNIIMNLLIMHIIQSWSISYNITMWDSRKSIFVGSSWVFWCSYWPKLFWLGTNAHIISRFHSPKGCTGGINTKT